ncbi:hypothetical protein SAY86_020054 [Trapa natans]|uniref:Uncharacterized protein n=1 Tax=Trapa natans TaxID=22666 RepID=A0AAN7R583_TRANT|nr:hypothetical protein SAY86_020054 [Trapa natans]
MAEAPSNKRPRGEPLSSTAFDGGDAGEAFKRLRPYEDILSLLDDEEDHPHQDVSHLMTTLQQEISSPSAAEPSAADGRYSEPDGEDEGEKVMRHLFEASDDELGLPSMSDGSVESGKEACDAAELTAEGLDDLYDGGLWEMDDEATNYYAVLQSELSMK